MKKEEVEVLKLECKIDDMLKKSYLFKHERVTGKSVYEIELLKLEIHSNSEKVKSNQIDLMLIGIALTVILQMVAILIDKSPLSILGLVFILVIILVGNRASKTYKRAVELDTYGIGLMDLLIERKERE